MEGFLTEEQIKELLSELRLERNCKYADRIRVILLLDKGKFATKISEYFLLVDILLLKIPLKKSPLF